MAEEEPQKYAIQKIVDNRDEREKILFRARWFSFGIDKDTWKPENSIPQHFIESYGQRLKPEKKRAMEKPVMQ